MKTSFFYPIMGTGRTRQGQADKTAILIADWVTEVPEASGDEAPVALRMCLDGKPQFDIRVYEGVLYRAFASEEGISLEQDGGLRVRGISKRLERILGNHMQKELAQGRARQSYYPDGIAAGQVVHDMQSGAGQIERWRKPEGNFVLDDQGIVEAERWREFAEEAAGCLLVVDGTLWERCEEPVYKIAVRASPGVEVLGGRRIAAITQRSMFATTDPDDRLFSALEYDRALEAKATAEPYRKRDAKEDNDYIEVLMPEVVRYQSAEGELRRLARFLVEDVERSISDAARKASINWSHGFSIALVAAWNDVRNAELGVDLPGGLDRLETAVASLVAVMAPFDANPHGCLRDEDVEALLSRWQDREITLDSVPYGLAKP